MLIRITVLFVVLGHVLSTTAAEPIDVGSDKQLILDGLFLAKSNGVTLRVQPPRKTGDATLKREHEWESVALNWFSVLQDRGRVDKQAKYRMWYEAYDIDGWPTANDTSFCYAESRDGIHWTKPKLTFVAYKKNKQTNILFRQIGSKKHRNFSRVHGTCVFLDPQGPAAQRYKGVGQGLFRRPGKRPHRIAGMVSADGLKWTRLDKPVCTLPADSQYSGFWDPARQRYLLYGRVGGRGRSLGRSESKDFARFDPLKLVAQTDDKDLPKSDLYNSAVIKYPYAPNVYLMFPSLYQHVPDTLDIRLAVSRDGIRWTRPDRKTPYIALGKGRAFDSGSLYMGRGMVRVKDELFLYYSGSPLKHQEVTLKLATKPENARVYSRVVTRLGRFVAATAGDSTGSFTTPELRHTGSRLQLNVRTLQGGRVRVAVLQQDDKPIGGYSLADCKSITSDSLSATVSWKSGADLGKLKAKPIRLQVEMTNARLYGFQFVPDKGR